ncbi:MAG: class I SAM-dependent methyltransferase family protein [Promethearchaeota archaeon]|nr:MAG: class I SAM-dependent methyltransferase family protein [Candidatus Lokiarchaeota archaeon]
MGNNKNPEIPYIKLKKKDGQYFINFIKSNLESIPFINHKFKTLHENDYILFPIFQNQVLIDVIIKKLDRQINLEIISQRGKLNKNYKYRTLQEALEGTSEDKIPEKYLELIPKSYDIIGHIAIIEFDKIDKEFNKYKEDISKAILSVNKNIKTVYEKRGQIKGKYRLRELVFLYGEDKSETIHKENNCNFKLDIKKTYFSPRLVFERRRIASSEIKENELIVDMFAGVGTFSIQIAKNKNVKIFAFDVNPNAYRYMKDNIKLNKLKGEIIPNNIDIKVLLDPKNQLGKSLYNKVDRIIMNLPENSISFINIACFLMKESGGILHFYQFSEKPNPIEKTLKNIEEELNSLNWEINSIITSKVVKHYSPKSELIVVDLEIKPSK